MVIAEPNKFVAEVHDRMPVILETKDFEQWERGDPTDAAALMKPAPLRACWRSGRCLHFVRGRDSTMRAAQVLGQRQQCKRSSVSFAYESASRPPAMSRLMHIERLICRYSAGRG
jgi:hypothetical protein